MDTVKIKSFLKLVTRKKEMEMEKEKKKKKETHGSKKRILSWRSLMFNTRYTSLLSSQLSR
jgi:hypothetical protein